MWPSAQRKHEACCGSKKKRSESVACGHGVKRTEISGGVRGRGADGAEGLRQRTHSRLPLLPAVGSRTAERRQRLHRSAPLGLSIPPARPQFSVLLPRGSSAGTEHASAQAGAGWGTESWGPTFIPFASFYVPGGNFKSWGM